MQACRGGCDRSFMLGVYCLVSFFIFFVRFSLDVFRKGGFAKYFEHLPKFLVSAFPKKPNSPTSACCVVDYLGNQLITVAEVKFVPDANFSRGIYNHIPKTVGFIQFPKQENFNF